MAEEVEDPDEGVALLGDMGPASDSPLKDSKQALYGTPTSPRKTFWLDAKRNTKASPAASPLAPPPSVVSQRTQDLKSLRAPLPRDVKPTSPMDRSLERVAAPSSRSPAAAVSKAPAVPKPAAAGGVKHAALSKGQQDRDKRANGRGTMMKDLHKKPAADMSNIEWVFQGDDADAAETSPALHLEYGHPTKRKKKHDSEDEYTGSKPSAKQSAVSTLATRSTKPTTIVLSDEEDAPPPAKLPSIEPPRAVSPQREAKVGANLYMRPDRITLGADDRDCPFPPFAARLEFHVSDVQIPLRGPSGEGLEVRIPYKFLEKILFHASEPKAHIALQMRAPDRREKDKSWAENLVTAAPWLELQSDEPKKRTAKLWFSIATEIRPFLDKVRTKHGDWLSSKIEMDRTASADDLGLEVNGRTTRSQTRTGGAQTTLTQMVSCAGAPPPLRQTTTIELADEPVYQVLQYPLTATNGITLTNHDYNRLQPNEFLNDSIIDFYLRYMLRDVYSSRKDVYVFSTFFFSKLAADKDQIEGTLPDSIHRWTRHEDIFQRRFLVVPVNDKSHWSVVIVCNAGKVAEYKAADKKEGDIPIDERACMILFDSLGMHAKTRIFGLLRTYLNAEWKKRRQESGPFTSDRFLKGLNPKVPTQNNSSDCGLFVLKYVEKFLFEEQPVTKFYAGSAHADWFPADEAANMRGAVRIVIDRLIAEASGEKEEAELVAKAKAESLAELELKQANFVLGGNGVLHKEEEEEEESDKRQKKQRMQKQEQEKKEKDESEEKRERERGKEKVIAVTASLERESSVVVEVFRRTNGTKKTGKGSSDSLPHPPSVAPPTPPEEPLIPVDPTDESQFVASPLLLSQSQSSLAPGSPQQHVQHASRTSPRSLTSGSLDDVPLPQEGIPPPKATPSSALCSSTPLPSTSTTPPKPSREVRALMLDNVAANANGNASVSASLESSDSSSRRRRRDEKR